MLEIIFFGQINWIGVLVSTIACTILGGVWFAGLFSKQYALALGINPEKKVVMSTLSYVGPMICVFVTGVTSSFFIQALQITTLSSAALLGSIIGLGFTIPTMVNVAINPNFPHPLRYAVINAPFFMLCSVITSIILVVL
jgi:hypothetical protein